MALKQAIAPLVDLVYPPRCPLCGDAIAAQDGLCVPCWSTLEIPEPDPQRPDIVAATLYTDTARKLVLSLKHGRKIALATMMARQMAGRLGALEGNWLAVPVPLHPVRLWQRGFNQSALMARELCKRSGARLCVDGLKRTRQTPSLGGLGKAARAEVLEGAIAANPRRKAELQGASVLLVDDVLTSGATTNACITALRSAGARHIRIVCFSRVVEH
ncbi:ComF family protein [Aurantiacibacter gangjinensis]|uniref:Amidophosphoribosyltransferase n=1 Tax=Aurantiacibacter gangjinensis TaxID=502682 RepID=A0A0G9MQ74_9SPHN|nr:double zinc ribbon domain-containing protein [Aurantiacibacter gangjinensis]APE28726.1 Competence protein F-like protein, phosphoribosyltransferase domain [Aurantiacibacter gangjinensis]KLE32887.1 amidophosphoribosyltransferase [Aurantiacibacter gangjinensis]